MQRTLFHTRQPGLSASPTTPSPSTGRSTRQRSLSTPQTRDSTASSPVTVDHNPEPRVQNNPSNPHALRLPPPHDQYYGCVFPLKWDQLFLGQRHLTGEYGYRVLHKRMITRNTRPSGIWLMERIYPGIKLVLSIRLNTSTSYCATSASFLAMFLSAVCSVCPRPSASP